jgi:hypothetical protein
MDFGEQFAKLQVKTLSYGILTLRPPMHCKDGSTFSIQASGAHYCSPKNSTGPYTHYEVGYPEDATGKPLEEPLLQEYGDYPVYGFVPENVVVQILIKHGGLTNAHR